MTAIPDVLRWNDVLAIAAKGNPAPPRRVEKSPQEWRSILDPQTFHVAREKGTEPPNSSAMCDLFEPGQYRCVCCNTLLFDSGEKFHSGTGWPSFTRAVAPDVVAYHEDSSYGRVRIEATCNVCDAHLGHVFPDGPPPSGLRYCINALSLARVPAAGDA